MPAAQKRKSPMAVGLRVKSISKIATDILTDLVRFALLSDAVVPVVAVIALKAVFAGLAVLI